MSAHKKRFITLVLLGFLMGLALISYPDQFRWESLIGAAITLVGSKIPIDFALGLPISFFYAGMLPNDAQHRSSRLIAVAFSPVVIATGGYVTWLSWQSN